MNRGRRRKTLPDLAGAQTVEFVEARKAKMNNTWNVTLKINGWPHTIRMWAEDELDVMKQVFAIQRGEKNTTAFDASR